MWHFTYWWILYLFHLEFRSYQTLRTIIISSRVWADVIFLGVCKKKGVGVGWVVWEGGGDTWPGVTWVLRFGYFPPFSLLFLCCLFLPFFYTCFVFPLHYSLFNCYAGVEPLIIFPMHVSHFATYFVPVKIAGEVRLIDVIGIEYLFYEIFQIALFKLSCHRFSRHFVLPSRYQLWCYFPV